MKGFMTQCLMALLEETRRQGDKETRRQEGKSGWSFARLLVSLSPPLLVCSLGGCDCYRNLVDPCYPERYEYASRHEVNAAFAPQVNNGHFLDQTVWNYQFEPGTDKLTPGGMEHLTYLARRRPYPDCTVYLATAHDIVYDPAAPDKYAEQRTNLDQKRIQAIQTYLTAETAGRHVSFDVVVHDPAEVGLAAPAVGYSIGRMYPAFQGALTTGGGTSTPAAIAGAAAAGAAAGSVGAATAGAPPGGPPR